MTSEERTGGEHGSRVGRPSAQQDKHPSEPRTNWMSGKEGWCSAGRPLGTGLRREQYVPEGREVGWNVDTREN